VRRRQWVEDELDVQSVSFLVHSYHLVLFVGYAMKLNVASLYS
jgi:hypothetical protein